MVETGEEVEDTDHDRQEVEENAEGHVESHTDDDPTENAQELKQLKQN
jgi:hypothetical protein